MYKKYLLILLLPFSMIRSEQAFQPKYDQIEAIFKQKTRYSHIDIKEMPKIEDFFFTDKVPSIIEDFISKLKDPNDPKYKDIRNCLILNGPPGTGKTMIGELVTRLAHAEAGRYVLSIKGNDFGDRFKNSEKEDLREYFERVHEFLDNPLYGKDKSVIILFDEFDGVAKDGEKQNQFNDNLAVVKQLNGILDEVQDDPRIAIVATTNYLENIDESIFSRCSILAMPSPDCEQRVALIEGLIKTKEVTVIEDYPVEGINSPDLIEQLCKRQVLVKNDKEVDANCPENYITRSFLRRLAYECADLTGRDIKDVVVKSHARYLKGSDVGEVPEGFGYDIYSGVDFKGLKLYKETQLEKHLYAAYYEVYSVKYLKKENKKASNSNNFGNHEKIERCPHNCLSQEKRMIFPYALDQSLPQLTDILSFKDENGLPLAVDNFVNGKENRLIVYGPSGTGKSTVAEHVARLSGRKIRYVTGNFGDMFCALKADDLKKHFDDIKVEANKTNTPVVIVFDNINTNKSQLTTDVVDTIKVLNQTLASLSGDKLVSIIVVADSVEKVTNMLKANCETLKIDYPDYKTRKQIFEYYLDINGIGNSLGTYVLGLVSNTEGWSVNSIKNMINNAAIQSKKLDIKPKYNNRKVNMWQDMHACDFKNRKRLSLLRLAKFPIDISLDYVLPTRYSDFMKFLHQNYLIELEKNQEQDTQKEKSVIEQLVTQFIAQRFGVVFDSKILNKFIDLK